MSIPVSCVSLSFIYSRITSGIQFITSISIRFFTIMFYTTNVSLPSIIAKDWETYSSKLNAQISATL